MQYFFGDFKMKEVIKADVLNYLENLLKNKDIEELCFIRAVANMHINKLKEEKENKKAG